MQYKRAILTHGGAGSDPKNSDGPLSAATIGMDLMRDGQSAFEAVINAVKYLEDDPRFNAGTGSQIRADGSTIQMDASCMRSDGDFGAVACIEGVINPVDVARAVLLNSSNVLLTGAGARNFAIKQNIEMLPANYANKSICSGNDNSVSCDTVGAVAFDGNTFAVALSSGGLAKSDIGRVGDVPLPGCGLFCGSAGAVACTGDGEFIALKILAREVYSWLQQNMSASEAVKKALTLFDDTVDVGLIVVTANDSSADSKNGMAWAHLEENK